MKILITGSHGLVGSALIPELEHNGHTIIRLVRKEATGEKEVRWDIENDFIEKDKLEGLDAVVHLAGENISTGRWTKEKKDRIRDSRVMGTFLLAKTLAELNKKPKLLASASAIGFYGDRGFEVLNEKQPAGLGFLSTTCIEWETATEPAQQAGINVIWLRFGVVLSPKGGALAKMLPVFKLGMGGKIGSGFQYMSWISINDAVAAIQHLLNKENLSGPFNIVAKEPVTNLDFTKALGKVLSRPTVLPLPRIAAKIALGEMADELLLSSACVIPSRLVKSGFNFQHSNIEEALISLIGK